MCGEVRLSRRRGHPPRTSQCERTFLVSFYDGCYGACVDDWRRPCGLRLRWQASAWCCHRANVHPSRGLHSARPQHTFPGGCAWWGHNSITLRLHHRTTFPTSPDLGAAWPERASPLCPGYGPRRLTRTTAGAHRKNGEWQCPQECIPACLVLRCCLVMFCLCSVLGDVVCTLPSRDALAFRVVACTYFPSSFPPLPSITTPPLLQGWRSATAPSG